MMKRTVFADARWRGTQVKQDPAMFEIEFENGANEIMAVDIPHSEVLLLYLSIEQRLRSLPSSSGQLSARDPNKPMQLSARKPSSFVIQKNALTGDPILVFDQDTPTQMAIEVPRAHVPSVVQLLLPYMREAPKDNPN